MCPQLASSLGSFGPRLAHSGTSSTPPPPNTCCVLSDTDPGPIGAGCCWFDTSGSGQLFVRNNSNTGWIAWSCVALDGNTYALTPSGVLAKPNPPTLIGGNWTFTGTHNITYWSVGGTASEYPIGGEVGTWGNGGVGNCVYTSGGIDYGVGGLNRLATIKTIGPGTLQVVTAVQNVPCVNNGQVGLTAQRSGTSFVVDQMLGFPGDTLTIVIPNDGFCAHFSELSGSFGNGEMGFVSASWLPNLN